MNLVACLATLLVCLAIGSAQSTGEPGSIPPVSLVWPPYREGTDGTSTTAPCGAWTGELTRHEFPIGTYRVPMISSNETWVTKLAISYSQGPYAAGVEAVFDEMAEINSNDDFELIFTGSFLNDDKQCIALDTPADIEPGMPATLQVQYFDSNDTDQVPHYACSDLIFVPRKAWKESTPCYGPFDGEADIHESLHPPPRIESVRPSQNSVGSVTALLAVLVFAYIAYVHILPRMRQRQLEEAKAMEMAPMIS